MSLKTNYLTSEFNTKNLEGDLHSAHKDAFAISEIVSVSSDKVICDGGFSFGHPRVFLKIKKDEKKVICPYCGKGFVRI